MDTLGSQRTVTPPGFVLAIRRCFSKYVDFSGRAPRSEYWWFQVMLLGVLFAYGFAGLAVGQSTVSAQQWVLLLGLVPPSIAVAVRRLHDLGMSGWWLLVSLVPLLGGIVMLVFTLLPSDEYPNRYGDPAPLGISE